MYYNFETSNRSFLDLSFELKSKGISNYQWMLIQQNPEIVNLDPYSENLTQLDKINILKECIQNPMYFFREIVRIPTIDGYISFNINKATAAKIFCNMQHISTLSMHCRQTLKTTSSLVILMYIFLFGDQNKNILIQNKDSKIAIHNLTKISEMIDLLPDYIKYYQRYTKPYSTNITKIENSVNNNIIHIGPGPKNSIESYEKIGRSFNANYALIDDMTTDQYFKYYYDSIRPQMSILKSVIDITSIYKNTDWLYEQWLCGTKWSDKFYDININTILHNNYPLMIIHYEPEQLLDKNQLKFLKSCLGNDENLIRSEMCIKPFEEGM